MRLAFVVPLVLATASVGLTLGKLDGERAQKIATRVFIVRGDQSAFATKYGACFSRGSAKVLPHALMVLLDLPTGLEPSTACATDRQEP